MALRLHDRAVEGVVGVACRVTQRPRLVGAEALQAVAVVVGVVLQERPRWRASGRVVDFMVGLDEHMLVTAHVHNQFDREIGGLRSVNPGSVGLPTRAAPALLGAVGAGVQLRRTDYDVARAVGPTARAGSQPRAAGRAARAAAVAGRDSRGPGTKGPRQPKG
jgi:hypothetical protein